MIMKSGYSRDKKEYDFTPFTIDEHKDLVIGGHCKAVDRCGELRDVKITSIKTWKRRPDIEIHWKYGLYEFGVSLLTPEGFGIDVVLGSATIIEKGE